MGHIKIINKTGSLLSINKRLLAKDHEQIDFPLSLDVLSGDGRIQYVRIELHPNSTKEKVRKEWEDKEKEKYREED